MQAILPPLEAAESVSRCAWYSTRNIPARWVNESYLLPPSQGSGWQKNSHSTCADNELKWLAQGGSAGEYEALTLDTEGCECTSRVMRRTVTVQIPPAPRRPLDLYVQPAAQVPTSTGKLYSP